MLTPEMVHSGRADEVLHQRHQILMGAYRSHPERFFSSPPAMQTLPQEVWINKPEKGEVDKTRFELQSPIIKVEPVREKIALAPQEQELWLH